LGNSALTQAGTGSSARIGVNQATPAGTLDVNGSTVLRGLVRLPGAQATATAGGNSQAVQWQAWGYNSGTLASVAQNFQWQAVASGNNTASPSANLQLLFAAGSATPK